MLKEMNHVGIAVRNLSSSKELFQRLFGLAVHHEEAVVSQKVNTATFRVGSTFIELLEGTSPDSSVSRFVEKRGEGIHHLSFVVENIEQELKRLKESGFRLVDEKPLPGANNCLVAFLHPKSTNGVLIEISQRL